METTADLFHLRRTSTARPSRPMTPIDEIVQTRTIAASVVTGLYLILAAASTAILGAVVLPVFLVSVPFGLVLLWESVDALRSDEIREARQMMGGTNYFAPKQNGLDTSAETVRRFREHPLSR